MLALLRVVYRWIIFIVIMNMVFVIVIFVFESCKDCFVFGCIIVIVVIILA